MAPPTSPFDQLKRILKDADHSRSMARRTDQFMLRTGRRPRVLLVMKAAESVDSVDRLAPTAFSQWGFDVDVHTAVRPLHQIARTAVENDVHAIIFPFDDDEKDFSPDRLMDIVSSESGGTILQLAWKKARGRYGNASRESGFDILLSIGDNLSSELSLLLDRLEGSGQNHLGDEDYLKGIKAGDRTAIAKALTLIESVRARDLERADRLIERLLPLAGHALRIGISGVPGAGKSTFIETFGMMLIDRGYRVAVLAVDPSSIITGGSVLGDKTRMQRLACHDNAFIRPTASGGSLGGTTPKTRESIIVCEAAGFDIVLVETVGVGQSETSVASMVDFFMVLLVAGAGDELQGIKKGILELAHAILINKADGNNIERAEEAQKAYQSALSITQQELPLWLVPVMTCSALSREGLDGVWEMIADFKSKMDASKEFEKNRRRQTVRWMWDRLNEGLKRRFYQQPDIKARIGDVTREVTLGNISPTDAAFELLGYGR